VGLSSFLVGLREGCLGTGCLGVIASPQSRQYNPCVKRPIPHKKQTAIWLHPPPGVPPLYSDWFHTACIHITLLERARNTWDQIMQDFAKNTSDVGRELEQPEGEWSLDPASLFLGVLLGAIVVFAGLKASEYQKIQQADRELAESRPTREPVMEFEFYEELKREDRHPPLQR